MSQSAGFVKTGVWKTGAGLILATSSALMHAGCRGERPSDTAAGKTIVATSMVDMRGVNELTAGPTDFHTAIHYFALFLTLLDEQPDFEDGPPAFKPRLAESYELADEGRVLTFQLRPDVVWSDGVPVTAEDVRWTWQAQVHPDVAWGLASYKRHVRDVEVVGPHTVSFHFDRVYATQVLDANLGVILPRHAWSRLPFSEWRTRNSWFVDNLVVAGPFDLEAWDPGQRIVLRKNDRYFEPGVPRAERIIFRITPDRAYQLSLLRSGQAHFADWARPADAATLEEDPDIDLMSYLPRGSRALVWNTTHPLFSTKETRQALTLALDRQALIDTLYYGYANVTDSPFPSNAWVRDKTLRPRPYDPERARQLLATQGWTDSDGDGVLDRGGERFSFEILTVAGNELREDVLVMVQDQLARIGVEMRQRTVEFNTLVARERSHDFEVTLASMGVGTDFDLTFFYHSSSIDAGYNLGSYSNPEVDRALDELKVRTDPFAAKPLYDRLQALLYEDAPVTVLYEPLHLVPVRRTLRNVAPNALSTFFDLKEWELVENR